MFVPGFTTELRHVEYAGLMMRSYVNHSTSSTSPGTEPVDDPRVIAIGDAAKELDRLRTRWLNPEGASEAELKKRTLTNLYNTLPQWLQNAHAALDRAVWGAYGWDDPDPATVDEDTILSRLLALNLECASVSR